jgi:hypothetical protein
MMEPLGGLAQVALDKGDLAGALEITEGILDHLETGSLDGTADPFQVYLTCYTALNENRDRRAGQLLLNARHKLQERANNIDDEELRRSFLENVPSQRKLVSLLRDFKA